MKHAYLRYFLWAYIVTIAGLIAAFALGLANTGTLSGALSFLLLAAILSVLEISLSFDNAIVNANTLKTMTPVWQRRFLTWGILIAVFGMRIFFPLAIVAIAARVGPIEAVYLAISRPQEYATIMHAAHLQIAGFGGTFLMLVALGFFIDKDKEFHWFDTLEGGLSRCGGFRGFAIVLAILVILGFTLALGPGHQREFLVSAGFGLVAFVSIQFLGRLLDKQSKTTQVAQSGALGAFLYLEVLDASFSFDGVIGAFALTQNLFLIAIGLGVGAMYVRSFTIMIVEKNTLARFRYLEHGAFYSVLALSLIMFVQILVDIPELFTGLVAVSLIGLSLFSSVKLNYHFEAAQKDPQSIK